MSLKQGAAALTTLGRDNAIETDFRMGKTLRELEAKYGLSYERIRQIMKARGLTKEEGGSYMKKKLTYEAVQRMVRSGYNDQTIANQLQISLSYVKNVKRKFLKTLLRERKEAKYRSILSMCREGKTQKDISKSLNVSIDVVRRVANEGGYFFIQGKGGPVKEDEVRKT